MYEQAHTTLMTVRTAYRWQRKHVNNQVCVVERQAVILNYQNKILFQ